MEFQMEFKAAAVCAGLLAVSAAAFAQSRTDNPNLNSMQDESTKPAMRSRSGASAGEGPGALSSDAQVRTIDGRAPESMSAQSANGSSTGSGTSSGSGSSIGSGTTSGSGSSMGSGTTSGAGSSMGSGTSSSMGSGNVRNGSTSGTSLGTGATNPK